MLFHLIFVHIQLQLIVYAVYVRLARPSMAHHWPVPVDLSILDGEDISRRRQVFAGCLGGLSVDDPVIRLPKRVLPAASFRTTATGQEVVKSPFGVFGRGDGHRESRY